MTENLRNYTGKLYRQSPLTIHLLIILICTLFLYWQVYRFAFLVGWDDQWFVTNHYTEGGLNWKNVYAILKDFYYGQYAPINQLYYTILYSLFGYNPSIFHIGSLILHLCNITLVYFLLEHVTVRFSNLNASQCGKIVFVSSLLFAISPFNLEPVAWVAASKVLLYGAFYLLALNCYCKYIQSSKTKFFYLTLLCFAFSFGSKEQAVSLPFCLLLLDYAYGRNFKAALVWYEKVPFLVLSLFFGIVTIQSQGDEILENTHFYSIYERIILSFYTLSEYFTKTILPVNVSYLYPFPFQIGEPVPIWLYVYPLSMAIITFCFYPLLTKRWLVFGFSFFMIHILLVSNLLSMARFSVVADRYAYLATIGLYFILAFIVAKFYNKYRKIVPYGVLIFICYFLVYSYAHIDTWKNVTTLKLRIKKTMESRVDYKAWKQKNTSK